MYHWIGSKSAKIGVGRNDMIADAVLVQDSSASTKPARAIPRRPEPESKMTLAAERQMQVWRLSTLKEDFPDRISVSPIGRGFSFANDRRS